MFNIKENNTNLIWTVHSSELLNFNSGTPKETVEVKVSLGDYFVVFHYHPKAEMPKGAISGHSEIHVKGGKNIYKHENATGSFIKDLGVPTLEQIKKDYNET